MSWLGRLRAKVAAQQRARDMSKQADDDDPWSDVASSEGEPSPTKNAESANRAAALDTHEALEEEMARHLPYMPSLLGKDLPPCGLPIQVAYENVNSRLRERWLYFRGQKSVVDVCQVIKDNLVNQSTHFPPFTRPSGLPAKNVKRTPWRREDVFLYEVCWIHYFLREALAPEPVIESGLDGRANQPAIPEELGLQCNRKDVLELWDAWHVKKRARSPAAPDGDAESSLGNGPPTKMEKDA
ncbi:hypothetical protein K458DRAFT_393162 [Lentithecium fluviatile CBS 122367]|uniref:Uncharacterized protein n=1 Tax=Lentithecium fluviatile CBS 122367 TaxID=1168545 RepID=A0A6G1IPX1_9PLEO|nr:hypothetical protein K458DRAFT_393162 [Lentithecium fluviatile CBS 122367]